MWPRVGYNGLTTKMETSDKELAWSSQGDQQNHYTKRVRVGRRGRGRGRGREGERDELKIENEQCPFSTKHPQQMTSIYVVWLH